MSDPRRCAACASYRPSGSPPDLDPEGVHYACTNGQARDEGARLYPGPAFGCPFWSARDPAAYKTETINTALQVLYVNLLRQAGRTKLPDDVDKLDRGTRLLLEATALRLVQALGLLP